MFFFLFMAAAIILLVCQIHLLIHVFTEHGILAGILVLLLPIVGLYFYYADWDQLRGNAFTVIGCYLTIAAVSLVG